MTKEMKLALSCLAGGIVVFVGGWLWQDQKKRAFEVASPYEKGWLLIENHGCADCHQPANSFRAPILQGLLGRRIALDSGMEMIADAAYIRRSLLEPKAEVRAGYQAVMPSYNGKLTEDEIALIVLALGPNKLKSASDSGP